MVEYIDSSLQQRSEYTRYWLERNLVLGISSFRAQSGYFSYSAIEPFEGILRRVIKKGCTVRFVIGTNNSSLATKDAKSVLKLVKGKPNCSFTVVAIRNAEFHPKCYQITRENRSETALVGSGNLTPLGTGCNIEAAIILDTGKGDEGAIIDKIKNSIDMWASAGENDGAYQIKTMQDIKDLQQSKIIDANILEKRIPSRKLLLGQRHPKKTIKRNLKRYWTFKKRPSASRPSLRSRIFAVLVAEIPKGGQGTNSRWSQANFDKYNFEHFFGLTIGNTQQRVLLQHVTANGGLEPTEHRQGVSVKSKNYRLELAAGAGLAYPKVAPPICVFVRIAANRFRYRLLLPNDPHYSTVSTFLASKWRGRTDRMRRIVTDTRELSRVWSNSPLQV
jgi:hypothetical protein